MSRKRKPWWYRAAGIPKARRKWAKATGVPTTRAGRKAKARRLVTRAATGGRGCALALAALIPVTGGLVAWLVL